MAIDLLNTDAADSWLHDLFDEATNDDWVGFGDPTLQEKYAHLVQKYNHIHGEHGRFAANPELPAGRTSEYQSTVDYANMAARILGDDPTWNKIDSGVPAHIGTPAEHTAWDLTNQATVAGGYLANADAKLDQIATSLVDDGAGSRESVGATWLSWAASATIARSVAVSEAAREKFGLPQTSSGAQYLLQARDNLGESAWARTMEQARPYVDAQYKVTQEAFAKLGYKPTDTIDLYRGFGRNQDQPLIPVVGAGLGDDKFQWTQVSLPMRGATSWTTDPQQANGWGRSKAGGGSAGYVVRASVPVKDILSTGFTGIGVMSEQEMVVIGGTRKGQVIRVGDDLTSRYYKLFKAYNPDEPRVQSGPDHGEWTTGGAAPYDETNTRGDMPPKPIIRSANEVRQWRGTANDLPGDHEARSGYDERIIATAPGSAASSWETEANLGGKLTSGGKPTYKMVVGSLEAAGKKVADMAGLNFDVVRDLQMGWKGDGRNIQATAIVQAATERFHLTNNAQHLDRMAALDKAFSKNSPDSGVVYGMMSGNQYSDREAFLQQAGEFVKAQYAYTQEQLAKQDYQPDDTITLYRGVTRPPGAGEFTGIGKEWGPVAMEGRAVSSWAVDYAKGAHFAGIPTHSPAPEIRDQLNNGYVAATQVKVKDILATSYTGLGQGEEHEVVVLNGYRPVWARRID